MSNQLIVFPVTCAFFFVEALVHYHIGKTVTRGAQRREGPDRHARRGGASVASPLPLAWTRACARQGSAFGLSWPPNDEVRSPDLPLCARPC